MELEDSEKRFQEIVLEYGVWIQSMEEGWDMTYADFDFRRDCRNFVTYLKKRIAGIRKHLKELREARWKIWKLEKEIEERHKEYEAVRRAEDGGDWS